MGATEREHGYDVNIINITIYKSGDSEGLRIYPKQDDFDEGDELLGGFTITTDIFTPGMTGKIKFRDPGTLGTNFNINASEYVKFTVENPDIGSSRKEFKLCVEDVHFIGDLASEPGFSNMQKVGVGWEVNLIACESYINNWSREGGVLDGGGGGFIGKIASDVPWEPSGERGLVNQLAAEFENFQDSNIENTRNTVWIKPNNMTYPWGKDMPSQNLTAMIQTLTEYAIEDEDGMGVNYCFWQDMDGWYFKSGRKMIKDGAGADSNTMMGQDGEGGLGERQYVVTDDIMVPPDKWNPGHPKIMSLVSTSEWNHISGWQNGAYSAWYEYVKPNYSDPYWYYMDFVTQHQKRGAEEYGEREIITYDYHAATDLWGSYASGGRIEDHKLLPDPEAPWDTSGPENYTARKSFPNPVYGYFGTPYNNPNPSRLDTLGSSFTSSKYGPTEPHMWQAINDDTDLEASVLYNIQKKIKEPARENYKKYIEKKNLKEKWNVYRHSVCCDKGDVEKFQFLAVIEDAKLVQDNDRGGIYKYSWREVEMWPTDDIETMNPDYPALTDIDAPITIAPVPGGLQGSIEDE